ncbi:MAG: GNAT family N-acetyltransferase [Acidobacteriota bacterium]
MELLATDPSDFLNDELRDKAQVKAGEEVVLRASEDGAEVALVVLSLPSQMTEAELETLYVPLTLRKRGIASRALECAEDYCRQRGHTVLKLWANPLDDDTDQEWLIGWYKRWGYVDSDGGYAELEKAL